LVSNPHRVAVVPPGCGRFRPPPGARWPPFPFGNHELAGRRHHDLACGPGQRRRICACRQQVMHRSRSSARFRRSQPGRSLITGRDRRIRARYFLAGNGGGRRSGENTLKLRDYFLQFGVYVASVASLVLKVIAQCAQSPDHTSQCMH
jgi:hypothetical protein